MEHINENTIRVVIRNEDLVARGITFLDLLGNHREIENFFYSILEEVDVEEEFQGSEAITFQVLPKGDGLELFISKNISNEELNNMEAGEQFRDEIADYLKSQMETETGKEEDEILPDHLNSMVFEINDFEDMVQLANEIYLDSVWTNLYRYNNRYYLQITFLQEDITKAEKEDSLAQILEFANLTLVTSETLAEHARQIMERNALELTRYHFH